MCQVCWHAIDTITGSPSGCYFYLAIVQGAKQFDVSKYSYDTDTSLFTPSGGWDAYSDVYAGVTKSGV